jgi:hypothetical protein
MAYPNEDGYQLGFRALLALLSRALMSLPAMKHGMRL